LANPSEGLGFILEQAHQQYKLPNLFVTENGASFDDRRDGQAVHDPSGSPTSRPMSAKYCG